MPKSLNGLKSIFLYPLIGILFVGVIMTLLVEPMTAINEGMISFLSNFQNANPILLGIIVGSMSAFDMGGPVNKAAYVTGTALLGEGNYYFMAGVSAACITPPLITAFATLFFKKNTLTKQSAMPVESTLSLDPLTLQKERFHLQQRIQLWSFPS